MTIFRKKAIVVKQRESVPDIKTVEKKASSVVIGQNKAVRQIVTAICKTKSFETVKSNLLVVGNQVDAKKILRSVAKSMNIPYVQAKYYTLDNNIVCKILENANYDLEVAQKGIIVIEDIDKEVNIISAMENLVNFLETTEITVQMNYGRDKVVVPFKTKNLMIVFLGNFDGIKQIRDRRKNKTSMGFGDKTKPSDEPSRITKQDITDYYIPEEVLDKIDLIVEMDNPSKEQISTRLNKSKASVFRKYQNEIDEKIFDLIAQSSLTSNEWGKEVSGTINYIFENITYDVLANPGKFKKCEISLDIVNDNTKYKLS